MRSDRIPSGLPPEEPVRMLRNNRRRSVTAPAKVLNGTNLQPGRNVTNLQPGRKHTELNKLQKNLTTAPTTVKKNGMGSNSVMVSIDLALLEHKPSPQGTDVKSCTWSKRKGRRKLSGQAGESNTQQKRQRRRKSSTKEDTFSEELCQTDKADGATVNPAEVRSPLLTSTPCKEITQKKSEDNMVKSLGQKRSKTTFDQNIDKDECDASSESSSDSDDELPSMFAESGQVNIKKGDLAWVRIHKFPFWPCVVKTAYYLKKRLKKVSVVFIGDPVLQQNTTGRCALPLSMSAGCRGFCLNYTKQNVIPFGGESEQHKKMKEEGLASELKACFSEAVARAEDFVWKRCLGEVKEDGLQFFGDDCDEADFEDVDMAEEPSSTLERADALERADEDSAEEARMSAEEMDTEEGVSASIQQSLQRRIDRNQSLVEFIKTDDKLKNFLEAIYRGKRKCPRHDLYHKDNQSKAERAELRKHSFGPIDDDNQQDEILQTLISYHKDVVQSDKKEMQPCEKTLPDISYILDVWVPEAIIFALISVKKYSRKRATDMFDKGVRRTKEENRQIREELKKNANNIDQADRQLYDAKLQRQQVQLMKKLKTQQQISEMPIE